MGRAPSHAVDAKRGDGAGQIVEQIFLRIEQIAVMQFQHALLGAERDGARELNQFVNAADAENDENGADPNFPAVQSVVVAKPARDREAARDAEEIMDVAVEFDS